MSARSRVYPSRRRTGANRTGGGGSAQELNTSWRERWLVRSFIAVQHVELRLDPGHLLTLQVLGGRPLRQPEERKARTLEIQTALETIGGVERVSGASLVPLAGGYSTIRWSKEEALADPSRFQAADIQTVQPGFFETMRTPVIAGRSFTQSDNAPDRNYVIVDSLLAAKAFPREPAVGKRILIRARTRSRRGWRSLE